MRNGKSKLPVPRPNYGVSGYAPDPIWKNKKKKIGKDLH